MCEDMSIERLIEKHTMFPYYADFCQKKEGLKDLKHFVIGVVIIVICLQFQNRRMVKPDI